MEVISPVTPATVPGEQHGKDSGTLSRPDPSLPASESPAGLEGHGSAGNTAEVNPSGEKGEKDSELGKGSLNTEGKVEEEKGSRPEVDANKERPASLGGEAGVFKAAGSEDPRGTDREELGGETAGKEDLTIVQKDEGERGREKGGDKGKRLGRGLEQQAQEGEGERNKDPALDNPTADAAPQQPVKRKRGRPLKLDADGIPLRDKREKEKAEKKAARTLGEAKTQGGSKTEGVLQTEADMKTEGVLNTEGEVKAQGEAKAPAEKPKRAKAETSSAGAEKKRGRSAKLHADGTPLRESTDENKALDEDKKEAPAEAPSPTSDEATDDPDASNPEILPLSTKRKRARPQRLGDEEAVTSPKRSRKTEKKPERAKSEGDVAGAAPVKRGRGRPRKDASSVGARRPGRPPKKPKSPESGAEEHTAVRITSERKKQKPKSPESSDEQRPAEVAAQGELEVSFGRAVGKRRSRPATFHADGTPLLARRRTAENEVAEAMEVEEKEKKRRRGEQEKGFKEEQEKEKEGVGSSSEGVMKSGGNSMKGKRSSDESMGETAAEGEQRIKSGGYGMSAMSMGKRRGRPPKNKSAPFTAPAPASTPAPASALAPAPAPAVEPPVPDVEDKSTLPAGAVPSAGPTPVRSSSGRRKAARPQQAAC